LPKSLGKNDVINVVCGSDIAEPFISRTVHDGVNLEYDGSSELFIQCQNGSKTAFKAPTI
jgi:hypothetical protein